MRKIARLAYKYLKKDIDFIFYENQSLKGKGFEDLKQVFIDSRGIKYYTWRNLFDMPHKRFVEMQKNLMMNKAGIPGDELDILVQAQKEAFNRSDIAYAAHVNIEMQSRIEIIMVPELMFQLLSCVYISEREDPRVWDEEIESKKVDHFKRESSGGLYDFFCMTNITEFLPYLKLTESDFQLLWVQGKVRAEAVKKIAQEYLSERNGLTTNSN